MGRDLVETRHDRAVLAQDAGKRKISFLSALAGTLVAYGAFAVLVAVAAAIANGIGFDTNLSTDRWEQLGVAGGIAVGIVLLVSYFFGGYVAGRMARRSGMWNGFMTFVLGVVVAVGVAAVINMFADADDIVRNLRNIGVPTTGEEWRQIGTVAGIGSLVAMLIGSVWGGAMGERWHGRYMTRAVDPTIGAGVPTETTTGGRTTVVDDGTSIMDRRDRDRDRDDDVRTVDEDDTTLDEDRERRHAEH